MPAFDLSMPIAETAIRATVVLVGALAIGLVLRRASGTARHALWTATTGALLALPLLQGTLPTLPIGWWAAGTPAAVEIPAPGSGAAMIDANAPTVIVVEAPVQEALPSATVARELPVGSLITIAWLIGVLGVAIPLVLGHLRARRLVRCASACHDGRLLVRFTAAAHAVGVREPVRLVLSDAVRTPMTGGLLQPVVLLPISALGWSSDCLDAVCRHELVHVRRRDALRQLASRLSVALYWFHPLAWRAARAGALAREQACDEAVLGLGTRASHYARHLLNLADPVAAPTPAPALVRLDHPHLEERVMAILRASPAPASRRQTVIATLAIAAWTLCVAAAGPATAQAPRAPEPPAAPAPPTLLAAESVAAAPLPPARPLAPMVPAEAPHAAPRPPAPPRAPEPGRFDCDFDGSAFRTGSTDRNVSTRMHTSTVDGIRICVAVRGRTSEEVGFVPLGRLPAGAVMTLAASGPDGTQRLVVTGTTSGNEHAWFVNGRERPFDAAAAEWRDAMLAVAQASVEKSRIRGDEARMRGEIARARGENARFEGEIARVRGRQAAIEARAMSERVAPDAERMAEVRAAVEARVAEVEARRAQRDQAVRQRFEAAQVEMEARQAELEARQSALVERRDAGVTDAEHRREVEREVAMAERALQRDHQRLEQELHRMHRELAAAREHDDRMVRQMVEQVEEQEVRAAEIRERHRVSRAEESALHADARLRAIEERRREADVAGRITATERRIEELQADRRIAEIDARMEALEARLREAIRRL